MMVRKSSICLYYSVALLQLGSAAILAAFFLTWRVCFFREETPSLCLKSHIVVIIIDKVTECRLMKNFDLFDNKK